jgi:Flp pilus assembly protein TadB
MAEEKKEGWLKWLPATTVVFAVCATLSTFKGGGYSSKAVLSQAKASDQWAFYQAKSVKSYLFEMQKENLELSKHSSTDASYLADLDKRIQSYDDKIKKYAKEKEDISKAAKVLEDDRDNAKKHGEPFGMAIIFLQICILLSSISALIKKPMLWYISIAVGLVGILYFMDGFFLFF